MAQHSFIVTGNLVADPHYHRTGPKQGVCKFRLGANRQRKADDNTWVSTDQLWLSVECWGQLAMHARRSLVKGMSVLVVGTLVTHSWDDAAGNTQSYLVLKATHIGPDLNRYLTTSVVPQQTVAQGDVNAQVPDAAAEIQDWVDSSSYVPPPALAVDADRELTNPTDQEQPRELAAVGAGQGETEGEPPF